RSSRCAVFRNTSSPLRLPVVSRLPFHPPDLHHYRRSAPLPSVSAASACNCRADERETPCGCCDRRCGWHSLPSAPICLAVRPLSAYTPLAPLVPPPRYCHSPGDR